LHFLNQKPSARELVKADIALKLSAFGCIDVRALKLGPNAIKPISQDPQRLADVAIHECGGYGVDLGHTVIDGRHVTTLKLLRSPHPILVEWRRHAASR
jgi:hypothetical protein